MHRKMQNKMKMIHFRSVRKNRNSAKKGEGHQNVSCPHVPVKIHRKCYFSMTK